MEIISGECRVIIGDNTESELFRAGQSFYVAGDSFFKIETDDVLDYVCHFEGYASCNDELKPNNKFVCESVKLDLIQKSCEVSFTGFFFFE